MQLTAIYEGARCCATGPPLTRSVSGSGTFKLLFSSLWYKRVFLNICGRFVAHFAYQNRVR